MQYQIILHQDVTIAELLPEHPVLHTAQDMLEVLVNFLYQDVSHLLLGEAHLSPAFFDLSTGLAGDMLQKFANYGGYVAIVGNFDRYTSSSLRDFIRESNRHGRISFVATRQEALQKLAAV